MHNKMDPAESVTIGGPAILEMVIRGPQTPSATSHSSLKRMFKRLHHPSILPRVRWHVAYPPSPRISRKW